MPSSSIKHYKENWDWEIDIKGQYLECTTGRYHWIQDSRLNFFPLRCYKSTSTLCVKPVPTHLFIQVLKISAGFTDFVCVCSNLLSLQNISLIRNVKHDAKHIKTEGVMACQLVRLCSTAKQVVASFGRVVKGSITLFWQFAQDREEWVFFPLMCTASSRHVLTLG